MSMPPKAASLILLGSGAAAIFAGVWILAGIGAALIVLGICLVAAELLTPAWNVR